MIRCLLLILVLFAGGCKRSNGDLAHPLRINIGSDPQTLDPRKARDLTTITIMHMLFEGLTRHSKSGDLEMALAEDVQISEDGVHYQFHLRPSVWSNGDLVTSFDFAESWKTILDPQFPTDIAYQLYVIKNGRKAKMGEIGLDQVGIQTPDQATLIVELEQPVPYFLELLTMPSFFPTSHKSSNGNPNWALSVDTYTCNGPFVPQEWRHGDLLRVVKNNRYWESKNLGLSAIELFMMSGDTELRMFEEGKLDWAGSPLSTLPVDAVRSLKENGDLCVEPFSGTYFYRVNVSETIGDKKNPLSHPLFRKALAYALDRRAITEHVLQGGQVPAKSFVPPEMGLAENGYFHDFHLEKAKSFLLDALLELDVTFSNLEPIRISYSSSERNAFIAQAVQKQWEQGLGIRVELEAVEPKVYFQRISQKEYQVAASSWTADFNDPINFLEVFKFKDAGSNNTNWENPKYIDLLKQSGLCKNIEERKRILREAEQILMDQMPLIPLFHFALNYLQKEGISGVALSPMGQLDFRWAHFDHSLEKNGTR